MYPYPDRGEIVGHSKFCLQLRSVLQHLVWFDRSSSAPEGLEHSHRLHSVLSRVCQVRLNSLLNWFRVARQLRLAAKAQIPAAAPGASLIRLATPSARLVGYWGLSSLQLRWSRRPERTARLRELLFASRARLTGVARYSPCPVPPGNGSVALMHFPSAIRVTDSAAWLGSAP